MPSNTFLLKLWGRSFKKQQELDKRKLELCKKNNCDLIYVYPDPTLKKLKSQLTLF